jgi:hypothetical protein
LSSVRRPPINDYLISPVTSPSIISTADSFDMEMDKSFNKYVSDNYIDISAPLGKLMVSEFSFQGETDGVEISIMAGEEVYLINEDDVIRLGFGCEE